MASITKKFKRLAGGASKIATVATRASVNPLYRVTDKVVDSIAPGTSKKINTITSEILNPVSQTNTDFVRATATTLNPAQQLKNITKIGVNLVNSGNAPKEQRVIPDRDSYAASASKSASAAAKARIEAEKNRIIPDRASYSANAGATESIKNIAKDVFTNQQKEAAKGQGNAWNNAGTSAAVNQAEKSKDSTTPAQDAANISAMYPDQTELLKYYADLARWDGMNQTQNLPEVVVQSDYKKYLIWGGIALLAIVAWKKIK